MTYAMGQMAVGLFMAWLSGYFAGFLWKTFEGLIHAAVDLDKE